MEFTGGPSASEGVDPTGVDLFDGLEALEQDLVARGRAAGEVEGAKQKETESADTGKSEGYTLGVEIGFIRGCARAWLLVAAANPGVLSARAVATVRSVAALAEEVVPELVHCASSDERGLQVQDLILRLQAKFKLAKAQCGMGNVLAELMGKASGDGERADRLSF